MLKGWEKMTKTERPLGVTIIAILLIMGALISMAMTIAIPILLYNIQMSYLLEDPILKLLIIYTIIMIPISILLAIGLLKGSDITRVVTIILYAISILTSFIRFNFSNILSVFISLMIIYYLTRPHVKEFFYGI